MNEIQKHQRDSEKLSIELSQEQRQQKELKLENTIVPYSGHEVFEINVKTLEVKEAEYMSQERINLMDWINHRDSLLSKKIQKNKDCVYISALNKKNALKRYKQNKGSALIYSEANEESFIGKIDNPLKLYEIL